MTHVLMSVSFPGEEKLVRDSNLFIDCIYLIWTLVNLEGILAGQPWTGELGIGKDIVWIRIAWCWRQMEGAREVMAYLCCTYVFIRK